MLLLTPTITEQGKRLFIFFIVSVLFISVPKISRSQEKNNPQKFSLQVKEMPLEKVLAIVEKQTQFHFAYNSELMRKQQAVSLTATNKTLKEILDMLFSNTAISYTIIGRQVVLDQIVLANKITVSGYIKDAKTGELLIGASIYVPALHAGTVSNPYGFFSLTIPAHDSVELLFSFISYKTQKRMVKGADMFYPGIALRSVADTNIAISVAYDKAEDNIKKNQTGAVELSSENMNAAFSATGQGDVVNAVELIPGVQIGLDNNPGYFVRGGNADQNLIQLDEATLYNPNHLLYAASIFNSVAIKNATLIKGGFPASYGDHLSSVLDVFMKDGSNQTFNGSVQLGTIASSLELSGPIKYNKASFLIAARRSAMDLLLRPFHWQQYYTDYHFYDVNAKANYQLTKKDKIYLSSYYGFDNSKYSTATGGDGNDIDSVRYGVNFGNQTLTLRWNHLYSKKLFSNTSFVYNNYHLSLLAQQRNYFAELYSGIKDMNVKTDLTFYPGLNNRISGGINFLHQILYPASVSNKVPSTGYFAKILPSQIPQQNSERAAAYLADEIKTEKIRLYIGARVPAYFKPGIQYINVEPRFSFLYLLTPSSSVKISYAEMHQYLHLVRSFNASFPAEVWIGSSTLVKPESSRQASFGLFKNFASNAFQAGAEGYYKQMENQMLFKGKGSTALGEDIESKLIFGKGWSYGAEFFLKKTKGRLTGTAGYAYAPAYLQFDSLNLGAKFSNAHNREHSASASFGYAVNTHWIFSGEFLAATGGNITLRNTSSSTTTQDFNPLFDEEEDNPNNNTSNNNSTQSIEPNNYSLTPYNRLDLSIRYKKIRRKLVRSIESEWILSVYNVYARHNTYFAYRTINPQTKQPEVKEISFIPVIPSLTYSLKF